MRRAVNAVQKCTKLVPISAALLTVLFAKHNTSCNNVFFKRYFLLTPTIFSNCIKMFQISNDTIGVLSLYYCMVIILEDIVVIQMQEYPLERARISECLMSFV